MVNKNAALLVKDSDASRKLVYKVLELLKDTIKQKELSNNIKKLAVKNAADRIAEIALSLIK